MWTWANIKGASLVKMAELSPSVTERTQENILIENVRKSHPQKKQPVIVELNKDISVKSVAASFAKFMNLCTPGIKLARNIPSYLKINFFVFWVTESIRQFFIQESNFLSLLESTKWLKLVSYCLNKAAEASDNLSEGISVILQGELKNF